MSWISHAVSWQIISKSSDLPSYVFGQLQREFDREISESVVILQTFHFPFFWTRGSVANIRVVASVYCFYPRRVTQSTTSITGA